MANFPVNCGVGMCVYQLQKTQYQLISVNLSQTRVI